MELWELAQRSGRVTLKEFCEALYPFQASHRVLPSQDVSQIVEKLDPTDTYLKRSIQEICDRNILESMHRSDVYEAEKWARLWRQLR